uniref:CSON000542 protein n=1 Tax=Culicoides sonorensis TaxID=179676 RepID=A0A336KUT1_CULSO
MLKVWTQCEENENLNDKEKKLKVRELRKLITESDSNARTDDVYLIRWLNCRNWNVDAAYRRRVKHYNFRKLHPDWYPCKKFPEYEPILKKNISFMLEDRDKNGRRVYLARANRVNLEEFSMEEKIQMDSLWFDMVCNELETIENGVSVIIDMKGVPWNTVRWFTIPQNIKISSRYAGFTPLKYVEIHILNTSPLANVIIAVSFPFLSEGLKERIHFHRANMKSLHKYVGKDCLPREYGGQKKLNFGSIYSKLYKAYNCNPSDRWFDEIEENQDVDELSKKC